MGLVSGNGYAPDFGGAVAFEDFDGFRKGGTGGNDVVDEDEVEAVDVKRPFVYYLFVGSNHLPPLCGVLLLEKEERVTERKCVGHVFGALFFFL